MLNIFFSDKSDGEDKKSDDEKDSNTSAKDGNDPTKGDAKLDEPPTGEAKADDPPQGNPTEQAGSNVEPENDDNFIEYQGGFNNQTASEWRKSMGIVKKEDLAGDGATSPSQPSKETERTSSPNQNEPKEKPLMAKRGRSKSPKGTLSKRRAPAGPKTTGLDGEITDEISLAHYARLAKLKGYIQGQVQDANYPHNYWRVVIEKSVLDQVELGIRPTGFKGKGVGVVVNPLAEDAKTSVLNVLEENSYFNKLLKLNEEKTDKNQVVSKILNSCPEVFGKQSSNQIDIDVNTRVNISPIWCHGQLKKGSKKKKCCTPDNGNFFVCIKCKKTYCEICSSVALSQENSDVYCSYCYKDMD